MKTLIRNLKVVAMTAVAFCSLSASAAEEIEYVAPVYNGTDGNPINGIAYWTTNKVSSYTVVESAASQVTWGEAGATNWYAITNADVQIKGGVVCKGHVNLILCKGAKLTVDNVDDENAGIETDENGSFVIYGQPDGAGELRVTGGYDGAGIGGGEGGDGSNITINGGKVTATGGFDGAGIGSGYTGDGSNITINGGEVTATGCSDGAGIGGGLHGDGSNITINGGKVTATSNGGGGAGIGGGLYGDGSNITISNATVFVGGVAEYCDEEYYYPDCIGNGGDVSDHDGGIVIDPSAKIFFNLTGIWDYDNDVWIAELMPMPADFEGFTIMTPMMQAVDRVLVGGVGAQGLSALPIFSLTNAVTAATTNIVVNGEDVIFAGKGLSLTNDTGNLMLKAVSLVSTVAAPDIDNTTHKTYWGNEELVEPALVPTNATPVYVVYEANDGYCFNDGTMVKTNYFNTSTDPATMPLTDAPRQPIKYTQPKYVNNIASKGIERWETNTVYAYMVVESAESQVTWGEAGATHWYAVTNADVKIEGGVVCKGHVNLILCKGAKLTVDDVEDENAGIATDVNGSFVIYGQPDGAGELRVTGGYNGAGIGGGYGVVGSNITINGGKVTATGGKYGAGIGGGDDGGDGSNITVNGGKVTATGGEHGAGIGGGGNGAGSNITINGGEVMATGGYEGAGIGGGLYGDGSNITINGDKVTATSNCGGAGIGGGYDGAGSNITISNATVFVVGVAEYYQKKYYYPNCIGKGGGIVIDPSAKIFFNLTGIWDYDNDVWIEKLMPMPESFDGFTIMTPMTQTVGRVLVGGVGAQGLSALPIFSLTNAVTAATTNIVVNGEDVIFTGMSLSLTNDTGNLMLKAVPVVSTVAAPDIDNTTHKIYWGNEELVEPAIVPTNATPVYVVYEANDGYYFNDGTTVKTNYFNTSTDPATVQGTIPSAPHQSIKYTQPKYVNNIASKGIERWETNTVYAYTVVESAASAATWGAEGATNWYAVTNADVKIHGGVVCKGHVNLILCKGAKLTVDVEEINAAGIATDENGSFTVYGQSDGAGELKIFGVYDGAGIGGGYGGVGSNITINGGKVTVTAEGGGAGIGGGYNYGAGSNITINGGEVTATGNKHGGAGIGGGGLCGYGSNIIINGGEVTATGGIGGSGIGGGYAGAGSNITINGGKVTATSNCGGAGIGGGADGAGSNITISNATVFVVGVAECFNGVYYYPDCIGNGGDVYYHAGGIVIDPSAKIFFNLTGSWDWNADQWIEALMPMPADFDGFTIMTPMTQTVGRVLVGGLSGLPGGQPLPTFALTNAVTAATTNIVVNGKDVIFAEKSLSLTNDTGNLMLKAVPVVSTVAAPDIDHATHKTYWGNEELVEPAIVPTNATPVYVVYEADTGYYFNDGSTVKTNYFNTSTDPATVQGTIPSAPHQPIKYTQPKYVNNIASKGIERWETNTVYAYMVVESAASAVTWGEEDATHWYAVTNADVKIEGGVVCRGHVNLVLCKGAKLTVDDVETDAAGIATDGNGSFVIYGQPDGAGELRVTGDYDGAGIGGGEGGVGSNITINGGKVTVTAKGGGAGIGGGYDCGDGSNITINGGEVTATGGYEGGAGIGGGGYYGNGANITINGGEVTATGGYLSSGIGGGYTGDGSNITINGGKVTATSNGGGGAGIGGGEGSAGSNITISNATVFVVGVAECLDGVYYYPDCIGNGGDAVYHAGGIVIDPSAKIFFNLTGSWDYNTEQWIEALMPMPESFDGFTIMTPMTQAVDRVLVGGVGAQGLSALPIFSLTNAVTAATTNIVVNGKDVIFAEKSLSLTNDTGNLMLKAVPVVSTVAAPDIDNTTHKIYWGNEELVEPALVATNATPVYVVYEADPGYYFNDGTTVKTNYFNTSTDPATVQGTIPSAPFEPVAAVTTNGVMTLYPTLTNAWEDATTSVKDVDVLVTLLTNATVDSTLVRSSGGKILTLDLNDKVLAYAGANDAELILQASGTALHVVDTALTRTPRYFTCDAEIGLWTLTNEVTDRVVSGGLITGGRASALNVSYGGASISNVNFVGNCNAGSGGAVAVSMGSLTIAESVFFGNVSAQNGGAISAANHCEMSDCRVEANVATNCGGGVYMGLSGLLVRTSVVGNMAATGGVCLAFSPSCFPAGVKILMADGAEKNVEDIVKGDVVATFDHVGGTNSSAAVFYVYSGTGSSDAFALTFASGATLEIVDRHDLLSETTRKYVTVSSGNARTFIGSRFYNYAKGGWDELVGVTPAKGGGAHYSIYVAGHANCVANGLITVPDDKDCFINVYELDENLKADAAQLAADIATYGLATPADYPNIPPEDFADGNIRFARIAIGKGLVTQEELLFWNEYDYGPVVEKKQDSSVPVLMMSAEPMPLTAGSFMVASTPSAPYLSVGEGTVVTGNVTTAGDDSNVYLLSNTIPYPVIHILPDTVKLDVGVTLSTGAGVFGFENDVNHATCFTPDDPTYTVVYNAAHQLELRFSVPIVARPTPVANTTMEVYTNGFISAETSTGSGEWYAWSNLTAYVVYTVAQEGYYFADGSEVVTNNLDTAKNPATAAVPAVPAPPSIRLGRVAQRYPWNGMVDIGIRAKNWPASGYVAKLVIDVGETSVTNKLDFGTAAGAFVGEVAVDLNEIAPNSRGSANFEVIAAPEPAAAPELIVQELKWWRVREL